MRKVSIAVRLGDYFFSMSKGVGSEMEGNLNACVVKSLCWRERRLVSRFQKEKLLNHGRKWENCLVGKIWVEKPVNKEAFRMVLSKIWRLVGHVVFKELHDNLWLLEFSDGEDKRRVLLREDHGRLIGM